MQDTRIYSTNHDLGHIKIIPLASEFPWEMFSGGEINCLFNLDHTAGSLNDMRVWINRNADETVYIGHSTYVPCKIAFANPEDAVKFNLRFGEILNV